MDPTADLIGRNLLRRFHGVFLSLLLLAGCQEEEKAKAPPPPEVVVSEVVRKDVPVQREWIGTADGLVNAVIRAQVEGYLIKQNYREGELVKKGEVLFEIDPRPFQADLAQAKAELARQQARHQTSRANLARIRPLAEKRAVSRRDLDNAVGMELSDRAAVEAARAAMEEARLKLSFTRITSPIEGVAGIAKAQIGNLVGPGQTEELTTVSQLDPIKVYIPISEQEYLQAVARGRSGKEVSPELILADGSVYPHRGKMAFADRQVNVLTGTITVAVLYPNPGNVLRPGQFAKVKAVTRVKEGALLVPQRAVTELQGSYQVAVVGPANKVDIRPVKAAERIDNLWVIDEGVKPGEKVIVEGFQKVKQGSVVTTRPYAPAAPVTGGEAPPRDVAGAR